MIANWKSDPAIKQLGTTSGRQTFNNLRMRPLRLVGTFEKYHIRHEALPFNSEPGRKQGGDLTTTVAQDSRTAS